MTQPSTPPRDRGLTRGFALAWVSWVLGLVAYYDVFVTGFSFDGLTDAEETRVLVGFTVAMALTTVLPTMGLLAALVNRRTLMALGLAVAVALALAPVTLFGPDVAREWRDRLASDPAPSGPNGCVVYSGGSNTCPGG